MAETLSYPLSLYRSWFPVLSTGKIWLNHAAISPLSTRVAATVQRFIEARSVGEIDPFLSTLPIVDRTRKNLATLVKSTEDRIAFVQNTSDGINLLINGLHWKNGDRVLLNDSEFVANAIPFLNLKRFGVEIDFVKTVNGEIRSDDLEQMMTPRTRLLSISFVQFLSGFKADLASIGALCRSRGIIFCVDGIQGIGVAPFDVKEMNVDFVSCGGTKWLMGMMGLGFVYVSQEIQDRLQQANVGWLSNKEYFTDFFRYRLDLDDTARRYETGTLNMIATLALHASTSTLLEVGIPQIRTHVLGLTDLLTNALDEIGYDVKTPRPHRSRAGILSFACPNPDRLVERLKTRDIIVSLREGIVRVAPHFYNSPEEIQRAEEVIRSHSKEGAV